MVEPSKQRDRSMSATALFGAGALALMIVATVYFMATPDREVGPHLAPQAVSPSAQTTPNLRGNTSTLQQPAAPDTAGSGPNAPQTR